MLVLTELVGVAVADFGRFRLLFAVALSISSSVMEILFFSVWTTWVLIFGLRERICFSVALVIVLLFEALYISINSQVRTVMRVMTDISKASFPNFGLFIGFLYSDLLIDSRPFL